MISCTAILALATHHLQHNYHQVSIKPHPKQQRNWCPQFFVSLFKFHIRCAKCSCFVISMFRYVLLSYILHASSLGAVTHQHNCTTQSRD